jgi:ABC-2 type transport system ATP-binding protein
VSVPQGPALIQAAGLAKTFGGSGGVVDVDLVVGSGVILGLIGPSGCGKTTTVRLLAGIASPTAGAVHVFGYDPRVLPRRLRRRIGYLPQQPALVPELSVIRNLRFLSTLAGIERRGRRRRLDAALALVDLQADRRKTVADLSGGMRRRLALAATLAHDPALVFLDEPTAGIDPILRERFWNRFRELARTGRSLVVTTQYVGEAAECDVVGVLVDGRLSVLDTPEGLRRRAHGGDPLLVRCTTPLTDPQLVMLEAIPGVVGRAVRTAELEVRVTVDDETRRLRELHDAAANLGLPIEHVQPAAPDYDEVFVRLVQQERFRAGAAA